MRINEKMQQYSIAEITNYKVHGRTIKDHSPLSLFWTASGLELNAKGSELWLEVEVDFSLVS